MNRLTVIRTWIWLPALLLVIAVGLGAIAANPVASSAGPQDGSAAQVDGAVADGPEVKERIIDGECELVDANGVPLYDSQFEQRTGSSPCDQH